MACMIRVLTIIWLGTLYLLGLYIQDVDGFLIGLSRLGNALVNTHHTQFAKLRQRSNEMKDNAPLRGTVKMQLMYHGNVD